MPSRNAEPIEPARVDGMRFRMVSRSGESTTVRRKKPLEKGSTTMLLASTLALTSTSGTKGRRGSGVVRTLIQTGTKSALIKSMTR